MILNDELIALFKQKAIDQPSALPDEAESYGFIDATHIGKELIDTSKESEVLGFIGFLDLTNYSTRVAGKDSKTILHYLFPFLSRTITSLIPFCAIDKTIGDEVMFFLPLQDDSFLEDNMSTLSTVIHNIVGIQNDLGIQYPMKLGLSYGPVFIGKIQALEYVEWSIFGEPVNFSKRLHNLLKYIDNAFCGAFGILERDIFDRSLYDHIMSSLQELCPYLTFDDLGKVNNLAGITQHYASTYQLV